MTIVTAANKLFLSVQRCMDMVRFWKFLGCFFVVLVTQAQSVPKKYRTKFLKVVNDTLQVDSLSINPQYFKVRLQNGAVLAPTEYKVNFEKALLILDKKRFQEVSVEYLPYPKFLTQVYSPFDAKLIVESTENTGKLYSETTNLTGVERPLFDGLKAKGFITRGLTGGNNQNAVTNSSLDLTLEGKLSDKVSIRANIFDTNFPLQQNGYSQNITDFDRIFVELYSKNWRVKGGDISLENKESYFLNFEKQVSGIEVGAQVSPNTNALVSGAVVRGKFAVNNFVGTEGNQGPYKIVGTNNERAIIMVEGSDRVFVNGVLVKRGETADYVIDYNLGEIRFTTTYPITNDMRIRVEFQYAERNYTRFITYDKASYAGEKFKIAGYFYSENDAKNQPVQQSLSDAQKRLLSLAGDNTELMVAPSDFKEPFSSSKIQYKKATVGTRQVFEYTTDATAEVYAVTFTNVGVNKGDYNIDRVIATGTIYKYVGVNLGSFNPVIQLVAPTKLQVAVVQSSYRPSEKAIFDAEVALSSNDQNLFSTLDDGNNQTLATKLRWKQQLASGEWKVHSTANYKFIQDNFTTVQRFQSVEFNRDWNIDSRSGDQHEFGAFLTAANQNLQLRYGYQLLRFSNGFLGNKHSVQSDYTTNSTRWRTKGSWLRNSGVATAADFIRANTNFRQQLGSYWLGTKLGLESNAKKAVTTGVFDTRSHRFQEYDAYIGYGDTTKVFVKLGANYRVNDSIRSNAFRRINNRKTLYLDSKLIHTARTQLAAYANYRYTTNTFEENRSSLNSRLRYQQRFFGKLLFVTSSYETATGTLARQEYVYIKTEPGQGFYTWIDYNNDGVQQFNEFEVAQFQDQANYLRVPLPNINYVPTQKVRFKQSLTLNFKPWESRGSFLKLLSNFYNQSYLSIDNERLRSEGFHWNPFKFEESGLLGLAYNFRNSFYFRRNLENYSAIYTYGNSKNKRQFTIGNQENTTKIHQLAVLHRFGTFWLFEMKGAQSVNDLTTENLANRNYRIQSEEWQPKLSYIYAAKHRLTGFFMQKKKRNTIGGAALLNQQKLGVSYRYTGEKQQQITADFTVFLNDFTGNVNSPVAFQMLEGLQPGRNFTWNLLWNQKLNSILNLSLSYFGRKSEDTRAIHTGVVQLKAIF
jgi:hypothetical protein